MLTRVNGNLTERVKKMMEIYSYYTTRYLMLSSAFFMSVAKDSAVNGIKDDAKEIENNETPTVTQKQTANH